MKRRLVSMLLVLSMVFTLLPVQAFAAGAGNSVDTGNPFQDVQQDSWYYDAVQYVRINGLFNGMSQTVFWPEGYMTRGMFVTVLGRLAGVNPDRYAGPSAFSDVAETAYYAPYVAWAAKYGVTLGTGSGAFSPGAYVDRQQMAVFFVRYFETFQVNYGSGTPVSTTPADLDSVSSWARDAVLKLWRQGIFVGEGGNFNPTGLATRAQAATLCYRTDEAVNIWYSEPGVPSTRVPVELPKPPSGGGGTGGGGGSVVSNSCSVAFYDGSRRIDTLYAVKNQPLGKVPAIEKSSKAGAVLAGYYTDPEFTEPFYADDPVERSMTVYAKYEAIDGLEETLNFTSFAQMDQRPDLSFRVRPLDGTVNTPEAARAAVTLTVKDGSEAVALSVTPIMPPAPEEPDGPDEPDDPDNPDSPDAPVDPPAPPAPLAYIVAANPAFNEGCTYELTLAQGWVFVGEDGADKPETIRTAAFSIAMAEVHNLRMNENVKFLQDTNDPGNGDLAFQINGKTYEALTNSAVSELGANGTGTFVYDGDVSNGDILCVYVGKRPDQRRTGAETKEPAAYVKVERVSNGAVTFKQLGAEDQRSLYEIPDNFPFRADALPTEGGAVSLDDLDTELYAIIANQAGRENEAYNGLVELAKSRLNAGDFVTFHTGTGAAGGVCYGRVTAVADDGTITYIPATEDDILRSMDLYDQIETTGEDLLTEEDRDELEQALQAQAEQSGFAEEAAFYLADLVTQTEGFQNSAAVRRYLAGSAYGAAPRAGDPDGSFSLVNAPTVRVRLTKRGPHFGGVQAEVTVTARLRVPLGDDVEAFLGDYLAIDVEGSFTEELTVVPRVKGKLTYQKVLGIPFPNGVQVTTNLDVKNYTAFSFDAEIYSTDLSGVVEGEIEHVSSQLEKLMGSRTEEAYQKSLTALLEKYEELVGRDPGWITLVEKKMFASESCYFGICYGVRGDFVVRADLNLALGSSMEYEVGKRFSFWFTLGGSNTCGHSVTDLLDERFAFDFYVMGRIAVRMGVRLKIYVGIGTGDLASVGLTTEIGPYAKLYGFFLYSYSRYRPQNSSLTAITERKGGAIGLELGLYFTLGVEAKALAIFTYSKDFLDKEFPLYHAGSQWVYYDCSYTPEPDEAVYIASESADPADIVMTIPQDYYALDYMMLNNGRRGSRAEGADKYFFSVSNSNFSLEQTGGKLKVHVTLPEDVHLMRCTLTVTYKGKLPFSNFDLTTTIPLVWTDLSERQMKEYFTASVRVGNNLDGYDTVWRQKVLRGEEFNLPTPEEVKALAHWNGYRYEEGTGYGGQQTESLGITQNTVYNFNAQVKSYSVTVTGIEGNGPSARTYTAKYGEAFDFSDLENTGLRGPVSYTKFAGFASDLTAVVGVEEQPVAPPAEPVKPVEPADPAESPEPVAPPEPVYLTEPIDITQPINQNMAKALSGGTAAVQAQYVDDSVTAVFSFAGIQQDNVAVTTGRGMTPNTDAAEAAVAEAGQQLGLEHLSIVSISPAIGPIDNATSYTVECLNLPGTRADVNYDDPEGLNVLEPVNKLVGSLLTNLPQPTRYGYTFAGWADPRGNVVQSIVVPEGGTTLTARWTPNTYTLTLVGNGGYVNEQNSATQTITFDAPYGQLPAARQTGFRFDGWWTDPVGGDPVTADTVLTDAESKTVYAHWKDLLRLQDNDGGGSLFDVTLRTEAYDRNTTYTTGNLTYSQKAGLADAEGNPIPTDGFHFELKPKIAAGVSDGTAHDAGDYILEITRNEDGTYASYTEIHDILVINKADWVEKIWNTGTFTAKIWGEDNVLTNKVTVFTPTGDADISSNIVSGMRWRIIRHKSGTFSHKDETKNFGDTFGDNGSGARVEIFLVFPAGATSNNYNLPSQVKMYDGNIRDLYDTTTNPTLPAPTT